MSIIIHANEKIEGQNGKRETVRMREFFHANRKFSKYKRIAVEWKCLLRDGERGKKNKKTAEQTKGKEIYTRFK